MILLIAIIVFVVVMICIGVAKENIKRQFVLNTSTKLHNLEQLNIDYDFKNIKIEDIFIEYDTKRKMDTTRLEDILIGYIHMNTNNLAEYAKDIEVELEKIDEYNQEVLNIKNSIIDYEQIRGEISLKKYVKHENELFAILTHKSSKDKEFKVTLRYTSPQGRNTYTSWWDVKYSELPEYRVMATSAKEYQNTARYERSLMTASMRHDVLKRDDFRCQYCGATANDGIKLHVDHIHPIARGGKTTMENLQTLCERCNMGKSAKV